MGASVVIPERIDADTARALIGNEQLYRRALARAPWIVQRWRAGDRISAREARAAWEREQFDGAPRASTEALERDPVMSTRHRVDTSVLCDAKDYEGVILRLETQLFEARCELKQTRALRDAAREVPLLRGQLRAADDERSRLAAAVARLERECNDARLDMAALRRHESAMILALERRCAELERENADLRRPGGRRGPAEDDPGKAQGEVRAAPAPAAAAAARHAAPIASLPARDEAPSESESEAPRSVSSRASKASLDSKAAASPLITHAALHAAESDAPAAARSPPSTKPSAAERPSAAALKVAALLCAYEDQGGDLATAFTQWDETGDGQLSAREILGGLRRLGAQFDDVHDRDVDAIVGSVDREPDGHMDLADFVEFVIKARAHL
ncbi:hypothetical protein M885DRAFT_620168 [Pelagophyceae sp. CCMP2097]|nr:hypothetical protein M885DRAFT_620168 [Pelagophyceae sp. CCMP2097]